MNDPRHTVRADPREQRRQAVERRRFRTLTAPEAWGGAGLSDVEAEKLSAFLQTQPTD